MTMIRQVMPTQISAVGEDEVELVISTSQLARDGHIFVPAGMQLDNYRRNPIVLWQHLTDNPPVARADTVTAGDSSVTARVKFPPIGISAKADEIRGLVKAQMINAVSVGIEPIEAEPLDPKKPRGGQRVLQSELLEISFCNVPVDTGATVTARAQRSDDWKCGASRSLPIEDSDAWDGSAAEASVFEWAGGDDFDPSKARKAFLAYNASKPKLRGSYKLPIAHVTDGRLKVPKGAIRAAASRLPQADIPESVKKSAQAVIDHYKEQAGMGEKDKAKSDEGRALRLKHTRALERAPSVPIFKRGLQDVASLAWVLSQLGYAHSASEYEAALEGDDSELPSMLGECAQKLCEALCAMTEEECHEMLDDMGFEEAEEIETRELPEEDRAYVAAGKSPRARAWRRGIVFARAGKALSSSNAEKLGDADGHCDRAMKHSRALGEHHEAVGAHMDAITQQQSKASEAHGELGESLQAVKNEPEKATEHVARCMRAHKAMGTQLDGIADRCTDMQERHLDVGDAHQAMGRSVKSAQRCVRAVVEGATPGGEDSDSKDVQTSAGTADDRGSERALVDARRRELDLLALAAVQH